MTTIESAREKLNAYVMDAIQGVDDIQRECLELSEDPGEIGKQALEYVRAIDRWRAYTVTTLGK